MAETHPLLQPYEPGPSDPFDRLKAAHLGRRVVLLDSEVRRYLAEANDRAA